MEDGGHGDSGDFRLIPVIDLRGGQVVRARAGERDAYAPIRTPLASGSDPVDIARALLDACPCDTLYVADLDAIVEGREPDLASLSAIRAVRPDTTLWVDAGFRDGTQVECFLSADLGRPVLGSESQHDAGLVRAFGHRAVLSLDSRGGDRLGPASLHEEADVWPADIIVMSLARIGVDGGPDLDAIAAALGKRPDARVFAAGGVRGWADVEALSGQGAAGALVASAVHDGRLGRGAR